MRPRVLIADRDPVLRDHYQSFLCQIGFDVVAASDAAACVAGSAERLPDLIVLDADLPWDAHDGLAFFALLTEHTRSIPVPIILLSDAADPGLTDALPFPVSACQVKPLSSQQLARRIWALLSPDEGRSLA